MQDFIKTRLISRATTSEFKKMDMVNRFYDQIFFISIYFFNIIGRKIKVTIQWVTVWFKGSHFWYSTNDSYIVKWIAYYYS